MKMSGTISIPAGIENNRYSYIVLSDDPYDKNNVEISVRTTVLDEPERNFIIGRVNRTNLLLAAKIFAEE